MLTFFFPYRAPSGVASLFARLAREIVTRGRPVRLIDYPDGAMARLAGAGNGIELVPFARESRIDIGPADTLVLQAEMPWKWRRQLCVHPGTKLIEWQMHAHNLVPPLFPLGGMRSATIPGESGIAGRLLRESRRRIVREFVHLAVRKRSLFFQDRPGLAATENFLGGTIPVPILLPVPVAVPAAPPRVDRIVRDAWHVAWVGRLYDFKIHILLHTLRQFQRLARAEGRRVVFHLVGNGPEEGRLARLDVGADAVRIVRHGDLSGAQLEELLRTRVDLMTAMGTAALEGAALGLPTILLDPALAAVPADYRFRWLFEADGFEVGHFITAADCAPGRDSLAEIMGAMEADYPGLARRCHAYVRAHHALEVVTDRFLALEREAGLRFGDVPARLWRKSVVRRVYERLRH